MARDNVYICWKVFLEGGDLRSLAGSLTSNDSTLLRSYWTSVFEWNYMSIVHTWTILGDNLVDRGSFHVVDYVVAGSRNEMTIGKYIDFLL